MTGKQTFDGHLLADKLRGRSGGRRFGCNGNGFHARTVSVDLSIVKNERQRLNLKERGSVSRSTVENQNVAAPFLRSPTANPLRVADPRPVYFAN
jgi:hypothetical protein